eukprot:4500371-Alexandrium_andersonii.AAC.1
MLNNSQEVIAALGESFSEEGKQIMAGVGAMKAPLPSVAAAMGSEEPDAPPSAQSSLEPDLPPDSMQSTLGSNTTEQTATTATTADEEVTFEPFPAFES